MPLSKVPVIAIVDDDESFRRATASFVRSLGYVTTTFASAESFLVSASFDQTDCVISDIQMPGMTGIDLQRRLISIGSRLPVIFMTAFPEAKVREQAISAGALGFLDKPFNDEKLLACIDEALTARTA